MILRPKITISLFKGILRLTYFLCHLTKSLPRFGTISQSSLRSQSKLDPHLNSVYCENNLGLETKGDIDILDFFNIMYVGVQEISL